MKKFMMIGVAVCLAFLLAAPAMAVDVEISGSQRSRGLFMENPEYAESTATYSGGSEAYMDSRTRLQTRFKVSDNISVTTRFDALEKKWGHSDIGQATTSDDNIDWERAYMSINFAPGNLTVGRIAAGTWGTDWFDSAYDSDRIKWTHKKIGNLTLVGIIQKHVETDSGVAAVPDVAIGGVVTTGSAAIPSSAQSDADYDVYIAAFVYGQETWNVKGLNVYYRDARPDDALITFIRFNYSVGANFGDLGLQAEVDFRTGETENDAAADEDIEKTAFFFGADYNLGSATVKAGYVYTSGDADDTDGEDNAYAGVGTELERPWILTNSTHGTYNAGNLSDAAPHGVQMFYGGVSFAATENVNIEGMLAYAEADEVSAGEDDEYGTEFDIIVDWKIMDNLSAQFIGAYLSTGDYFKMDSPTGEVDDVLSAFGALTVSF